MRNCRDGDMLAKGTAVTVSGWIEEASKQSDGRIVYKFKRNAHPSGE
jgi:hypothetical protein